MSGDPSPIRIMAVDDHPLLRQGIVGLVADQSDMKMVAEASNGREAIQQFRTHRPDVLSGFSVRGRNKIVSTDPSLIGTGCRPVLEQRQ
jgi:hypothetical protein